MTKIFFTSFLQIGMVAINTVLLTKGYILGIFICSWFISMLWCLNVAKISVSTRKAKIVYSTGAGCGAVAGYFLVNLIIF